MNTPAATQTAERLAAVRRAGGARSAEDLRERWIQLVPRIMERTGIVCVYRPRITAHRRPVAWDRCFLDGRDADWEQERSGLQSYGKSGVAGPFEALFGPPRCHAEVALVYAEVFHRLGYLTIDNPVTQQWWQENDRQPAKACRRRDV